MNSDKKSKIYAIFAYPNPYTGIYSATITSFTERQFEYFNKDGSWICKNPHCGKFNDGVFVPFVLAKIDLRVADPHEQNPQKLFDDTEEPIIKVLARDGSELIVKTNYIKIICKNRIKGNVCRTENEFLLSPINAGNNSDELEESE